MIKITKEQINILSPLIPNVDELINQDTDEALLEELNWLIIDELDETQNFLSAKGIQLQKIWDEIFAAND